MKRMDYKEVLENQIKRLEEVQEQVLKGIVYRDANDVYTQTTLSLIRNTSEKIHSLVISLALLQNKSSWTKQEVITQEQLMKIEAIENDICTDHKEVLQNQIKRLEEVQSQVFKNIVERKENAAYTQTTLSLIASTSLNIQSLVVSLIKLEKK